MAAALNLLRPFVAPDAFVAARDVLQVPRRGSVGSCALVAPFCDPDRLTPNCMFALFQLRHVA